MNYCGQGWRTINNTAILLGLYLYCSPTLAVVSIAIDSQLQLCSSIATEHCKMGLVDRLSLQQSKRHKLFSLATASTNQLASANWLSQTQQQAATLLFPAETIAGELSAEELSAWFDSSAPLKRWFNSLSTKQRKLFFDHIESAQTDRYGKPLQPQIWAESSTTDSASNILTTLDSLSGGATPKVLYLTSANRDPFSAAEYLQQLFDHEAQWLALDASVTAARSAHRCSELPRYRQDVQGNTQRSRVYPKLTAMQQQLCHRTEFGLNKIKDATLLFISDGDYQLLKQSLYHTNGSATAELALIAKRYARGELAIAAVGNSAALFNELQKIGTDNPVSASSAIELQPLHSNKGGQLKLALRDWSSSTSATIFIGLDNNTAAVITDNNIKVVGENGAWLVVPQSDNNVFNSHYLQQGDSAQLTPLLVRIANPNTESRQDDRPLFSELKLGNDDYRQLSQRLCRSLQTQALGHVNQGGKTIGLHLSMEPTTQFSHSPTKHWCSYRDLKLELGVVKP